MFVYGQSVLPCQSLIGLFKTPVSMIDDGFEARQSCQGPVPVPRK